MATGLLALPTVVKLLAQCIEDEIGALGNTDLGQDCRLVAEGGIYVQQTLILGNGSIEAMTRNCSPLITVERG